MRKWLPLRASRWPGLAASAALCGLYALGGPAWALGFIALVPWLRTLDGERSLLGALLSGWAMSVAFTAAVFGWLAGAVGHYTGAGDAAGWAVLLLMAPLFQPQIVVFALVRHGARQHAALAALAAALAWVATEALVPRLLGDTLGHGLHPAALLRQAAAVGGATGLTLLLLLANEAIAAALSRRRHGWRVATPPLALAASVPLLLAGYGLVATPSAPPDAPKLRIGLVQANIHDYERLRREHGAGAVVREVLDVHYAMSYDAVERQHADAVLWSETVYPTTFGHAKSEAGAELDREIQAIVDAAGVPFVFGTYDRDDSGEYNAAAFLAPRTGLLGFYRKTRLFPFTEALPAWLDILAVRAALPWAGAWQAGSGARVMPLRLRDGREVPVLPLICRDDTDAGLAIAGARLGAQALLTMSNDAWFGERGAALHQAVAAFRSIETGLPQFRVTTNGHSALIDARSELIATTAMGERTLVIGDLPVRDVPPTVMVAWGDWVGHAAALALAGLAVAALVRRFVRPAPASTSPPQLPARLLVLPPAARAATALLRALSRASLLGMVATVLLGDGSLQSHTLALIRSFVVLCLLPEALAWGLLRAYAAQANLAGDALVLQRGPQRLTLALQDIAAIEPWRLPLPAPGASLRLSDGTRWPWGLAAADARVLAAALGAPLHAPAASAYAMSHQRRRRSRFGKPAAKFLLLPLLLAVPAFQLHQRIAYGSPFGEFYSYGLTAYLSAFALWWAAWIVGVVLCAAALRAVIEAGTLAGAVLRPAQAPALRRGLEQCGLAALYLGLPGWLLLRVLAA